MKPVDPTFYVQAYPNGLHDYVVTAEQALTPAVNNVRWNDSHTPFFTAEKSPILSVIAILLKHGHNVTKVDTIANRLWQSTLQYVRTCPHFQHACWGTNVDDRRQIVLLIQWENLTGWSTFQKSLGFSLLSALLEKHPSNRAMKMTFSPDDMANRVIEILTVEKPFDTTRAARKQTSQDMDSICKAATPMRYNIGWLEMDVPRPHFHATDNYEYQVQPWILTTILLWNRSEYNTSPNSSDHVRTALHGVPGIQRLVTTNSELVRSVRSDTMRIPKEVLPTSLASLLNTPSLSRRWNAGEPQKKRWPIAPNDLTFPQAAGYEEPLSIPYGRWRPLGDAVDGLPGTFNQEERHRPGDRRPDNPVDAFWCTSSGSNPKRDSVAAEVKTAYTALVEYFSEHCPTIYRIRCATDFEVNGSFVLLVYWKDELSRSHDLAACQTTITQLLISIIPQPSSPRHQFLGKQTFNRKTNRPSSPHTLVEFITFEVDANGGPNAEPRGMFERAYEQMIQVQPLNPKGQAPYGPSLNPRHVNWGNWTLSSCPSTLSSHPIDHSSAIKIHQFTTTISWFNNAVKDAWYAAFFNSMRTDGQDLFEAGYERLGHRIDALRCVLTGTVEEDGAKRNAESSAALGVQSRFLDFGDQTLDWRRPGVWDPFREPE